MLSYCPKSRPIYVNAEADTELPGLCQDPRLGASKVFATLQWIWLPSPAQSTALSYSARKGVTTLHIREKNDRLFDFQWMVGAQVTSTGSHIFMEIPIMQTQSFLFV